MKNDKEKKIYGTSESVVNSTSGREMGYEGSKGPKRKIKREIAPWRQIKGEKVEENKKKRVDKVLKGQGSQLGITSALFDFFFSFAQHPRG